MGVLNRKLAEGPLLDGLSEKQVAALDSCASLVEFKPGERVFEQGKEAAKFFLIRSGKISVELYTPERGPRPIQTVGAGDLLGTSWIVAPYKWQFDAKAISQTEAVVFNGRRLSSLCDEDHELGYHVLTRLVIALSNRLSAAQKQMLEMYARNA